MFAAGKTRLQPCPYNPIKPKENTKQYGETCSLHDTTIVKLADAAVTTVTITKYQCKKSKSVNILSLLHSNVAIPSENNPPKTPKAILFYNETKVGGDVLDQMSRCYSVKAGSRHWPIYVFYDVIGMALTNSWVIYKHVCNSSISRRMFIQRVSEELSGVLQTKGYKLKAMQLLQSVLQHLKKQNLLWQRLQKQNNRYLRNLQKNYVW